MVEENLRRVQQRIAAAARAAGRDPTEVRLVCVTKGIPVERIREAIAAGVREIGENRVQEAQQKKENMSTGYKVPGTLVSPIRWHLIGRLQRNKAKLAVGLFDVIHSVDSLELVEALTLRQAQRERPLEVLIQVNVFGEAAKGGCRPEEVRALAQTLLNAKNLKWTGLMTMAPYSKDPERARPVFRGLRELRDRLEAELGGCFTGKRLELSMGMSGDFETAVQEGATMVRIGTAIFGEKR